MAADTLRVTRASVCYQPPPKWELYLIAVPKGREQARVRPVLVLSINHINKRPLVVTVVVGTKGENVARDYPINVRVSAAESGLSLETVFLCFQIRSLDSKRFPKKPAGQVSGKTLNKIEKTVRYCLGL